VESDVDMSEADKLQTAWEELGVADPYWSVLTNDTFRLGSIDLQRKHQFFDSGRSEIEILKKLLSLADLPLPEGRCLDYGCGVGRVTIHLATLFDSVLGADISRPHLSLASAICKEHGIENVAFQHIDANAQELLPLRGTFAFIHSLITLQHSHPSIILSVLAAFGQLLMPRGLALFQVPTHHDAYDYDKALFGTEPFDGPMELHAVRQRDIFQVMATQACQPMGVFEIDRVGAGWSNHYFIFSKAWLP
jgi:SAM-dependent methyltransferase